jgi:hypothetical protein
VAISRFSDSSIQDAFPKYNSLWDGRSAVGSMDAISAITLSSAQSTITFSNIPQTYSHLQIRAISRSTTTGESGMITFNGDTAANYQRHYLYGSGATAVSGAGTSASNIDIMYINSSATTANTFAVNILDILDYSNTSKYKTVRLLAGADFNGSGNVGLYSGAWRSTSAITSITITPSSSIAQYSSFALYGIK